jgi:hypothetical protein
VATYLYGLVAGSAAKIPHDIVGIQDAPVRVVRCGDLGALVSTLERIPRARASLDNVRAHDAVLQSVVDRGATAAAVRFGQSFADDDDLCRYVNERGERVAHLLRDYDGCVEIRVLLAQDASAETPAQTPAGAETGPGRAYLENLRAAGGGRAGEHLQRMALRSALGPVVRAERVEELPKSRGVVFAHLVRRDDLPAYREALAALPALADAKLVGPLALYSFAEPAE